jgi:hypothetical protein
MPPSEPSIDASLFAGFQARELQVSRGTVHAMVGGTGRLCCSCTAIRSRI